jgi:hypothetical protein
MASDAVLELRFAKEANAVKRAKALADRHCVELRRARMKAPTKGGKKPRKAAADQKEM